MEKKLILVDFAYNGTFPKVTVNVSWKRMLSGIWENVKDFCRAIWQRRNVFAMHAYAFVFGSLMLLLFAFAMNLVKEANSNLQAFLSNLWSMWSGVLSVELGINVLAHQVGVLVLVSSLLAVIIAPAFEWMKFWMSICYDGQLTAGERWSSAIQKADSMVARLSAYINGTCSWVIRVAGTTAIVWLVWSMLQS